MVAIVAGIFGSGDSDALAAIGGGLGLVLGCVALVYMLALIAIIPAVYIQYLRHESIGACLQFSEVIKLTREHLSDIIVTVVAVVGVGFLLGLLGLIPCLGILLSLVLGPYLQWAASHMYGQICWLRQAARATNLMTWSSCPKLSAK